MTESGPDDPLLSLVIPTYNEADGLGELVQAVHVVLDAAAIPYELVVVDDNSPDGTAEVAEALGRDYPVRVVKRAGKLGLSSAVLDGWKASRGRYLGVMDADLSHDPAILPALVASLQSGQAEVAVGSRYIAGGGMGNWPLFRQFVSRVAVTMGSLICPVKDVTSGYFIMDRTVVEGVKLNPIGFKIALEVLIRGRYRTFTEVPYVFQDRAQGKSKLSRKQVVEYIIQLGQLVLYWLKERPVRQRVAPALRPVEGARRDRP